ncbi:MAG: thioredoxin family protein [Thermoplasmata archaeon]
MDGAGDLVVVTDENFDREVLRSPLPVVVDFSADWCAPCRITEPVLRSLAAHLKGQVKFVSADVDATRETARSFGVFSIPTYLFLRGGVEQGREVGPVGPVEFRSILRKYFAFA